MKLVFSEESPWWITWLIGIGSFLGFVIIVCLFGNANKQWQILLLSAFVFFIGIVIGYEIGKKHS